MNEESLERLIEHEIVYLGMIADCERTDHAVYLAAPSVPEYRDANRAVRLRAGSRTPDQIARDIVAYYRDRGLPAAADVDPIAERQGFSEALQSAGMAPVNGDRILMRYVGGAGPTLKATSVIVEIVRNAPESAETGEWVETAVADDIGWPDEKLWRRVAEHEANYSLCRLYIGRLGPTAAGVCDLFEYAGWGRVDSVVTRPEARRQGVASALVTRAVADSLTSGNSETYIFTEPGGNAERIYRSLGFALWKTNIFRRFRG